MSPLDQLSEISSSMEMGLKFLETQNATGEFREDFGFRHGDSTAWSTAYVGRFLADISPEDVVKNAQLLLASRNSDGGWGYNHLTASDADSTVNAILFLQKIGGLDHATRSRALAFVKKHQHANGGFGTYTPENIVRMGYQGEGWSSPHVCVTALAAHVLEGQEKSMSIDFLQKNKRADGSFPTYWWFSDFYSTLEAIKIVGFDAQTIRYFQEKQPADSFELALKIQGLLLMGQDVSSLVSDLLAMQQNDGSWPASSILKVPRPHVKPGDDMTDVEISPDHHRLFSTVNAVHALKMYSDL